MKAEKGLFVNINDSRNNLCIDKGSYEITKVVKNSGGYGHGKYDYYPPFLTIYLDNGVNFNNACHVINHLEDKFYTITEKPTMKTQFFFNDLTETQKQKLADRLISDHPTRLQNTLVEYVLSKSWEDSGAPFSYDDITNFEYYGSVCINGYWEELTEKERNDKLPIYEYLETKAENIQSELEDLQANCEDDDQWEMYQDKLDRWSEVVEKYQSIVQSLNDMDFDDQPQIYQWFSCSDYLIRKLEEHGQCTLDDEYWGRQACGQSITLDNVIQLIAFEYACEYGKDYLTDDQIKGL